MISTHVCTSHMSLVHSRSKSHAPTRDQECVNDLRDVSNAVAYYGLEFSHVQLFGMWRKGFNMIHN